MNLFMIFYRNVILLSLCTFLFSQNSKPPERIVTYIGLEKWTPKMIEDSFAFYSKSQKLSCSITGNCAIDYKVIGFPSAGVGHEMKNGKIYDYITLIEPQYKNLVLKKNQFKDTLENIVKWEKGIDLLKKHRQDFMDGLRSYSYYLDNNMKTFKYRTKYLDSNNVYELYDFIKCHNNLEDKNLALWIINNDGNYYNRIVATAILSNFYEEELIWWALVDELRDNFDPVSGAAFSVLESFKNTKVKSINWEPAKNTLRYLLNGTNVSYCFPLIEVLLKTNISPELSKDIFKDHTGILISYLKVYNNREKDFPGLYIRYFGELTYKFLKHMSEKDLGYDEKLWAGWIDGLNK